MLFNKPVSNPMLVGAIELMMSENTAEHKRTVIEEIAKAEFLCPVFVDPLPEVDENGIPHLSDGTNVKIPTLYRADGTQFFLAFTDVDELHKWKSEEECPYTYACTFDDYVSFLSHKYPDGSRGPAQGFAVNPCTANFIVDRDMVANILLARDLSIMNNADKED